MPRSRGKCPHCGDTFLTVHKPKWAWCSRAREVIAKEGEIDERLTKRFIQAHIESCLDKRLEREYGSSAPLSMWLGHSQWWRFRD